MLEKLKSIITKRQTENENMCGTTISSLKMEMNLPIAELNELLRTLYEEKFITVRKGVNHKLIFLANYDRNQK